MDTQKRKDSAFRGFLRLMYADGRRPVGHACHACSHAGHRHTGKKKQALPGPLFDVAVVATFVAVLLGNFLS
jgi:hypothetical protein